MLKKIICLISILVLSSLLFACGSSESQESQSSENVFSTEETGDSGEVQQDYEELKITESGYSVDEDNYVHYGFIVENPNSDTAFEYSEISVTAYDNNGDVLATDDITVYAIQPGEKQAEGSSFDCNGVKPKKIEFAISTGDAVSPSDDAVKTTDFEFSGVNERKGDIGALSVTGKIKNNSPKSIDSAKLVFIFKNKGKIVWNEYTYVDNLGSRQEKPFECSTYDVPKHDSVEIYAMES